MNDLDLQRELRTTIDGAAAPVSAADAQLRGRKTTRWTRLLQPGLWTHRVMIAVVATLILVVFFLPLPHVSLFKRLVNPADPPTATRLPNGPATVAPLADTARPKGWSPIAFDTVQISVPSPWFIENPGYTCGGGVKGIVFVAEAPRLPASMGCSYPPNIVSLRAAGRSPIPHARAAIVNGLRVTAGWTGAGSTVTYLERGLGMDVTASGPLAAKVLRTITHSPLSVVLRSAVNGTPAGWRTLHFGGLQFTVPGNWQVTRDSWWGGCPYDIAPNVVRLSTAQTLSVPSCPAPLTNAGYEASRPGMVIGAGPQVTADDVRGEQCVHREELRICIQPEPLGGGFSAGRQLGLLTAEVFLPGQTRPDQVEIGLSGSGLTPLRIFDSLRPSGG